MRIITEKKHRQIEELIAHHVDPNTYFHTEYQIQYPDSDPICRMKEGAPVRWTSAGMKRHQDNPGRALRVVFSSNLDGEPQYRLHDDATGKDISALYFDVELDMGRALQRRRRTSEKE